jgi:hypothetical protein
VQRAEELRARLVAHGVLKSCDTDAEELLKAETWPSVERDAFAAAVKVCQAVRYKARLCNFETVILNRGAACSEMRC